MADTKTGEMSAAGTGVRDEEETLHIGALDVGDANKRSSGWWGMLTLIATEAFLFVYLLFSYYFFAVQTGRSWLPAELPSFRLSGPGTVLLILSSVAVWWGERGARRNARGQLAAGLLIGIVLGGAFIGIQLYEWSEKPFGINSHSYGSLYYTITGFHLAHVTGGLLILATLFLWTLLGYFDEDRHAPISIGSIYWHFVDVVWLAVFFTFYITPYLSY